MMGGSLDDLDLPDLPDFPDLLPDTHTSCQGLFQKGSGPPLPEHRAEALDTRSSELCRGRLLVNACLGWSYG